MILRRQFIFASIHPTSHERVSFVSSVSSIDDDVCLAVFMYGSYAIYLNTVCNGYVDIDRYHLHHLLIGSSTNSKLEWRSGPSLGCRHTGRETRRRSVPPVVLWLLGVLVANDDSREIHKVCCTDHGSQY